MDMKKKQKEHMEQQQWNGVKTRLREKLLKRGMSEHRWSCDKQCMIIMVEKNDNALSISQANQLIYWLLWDYQEETGMLRKVKGNIQYCHIIFKVMKSWIQH